MTATFSCASVQVRWQFFYETALDSGVSFNTIPGTGSSGHLCGGLLLAAVVGPYAAFLTMIGVLLIQCLLFADGGLLALGANIWNMAFYGCFVGSARCEEQA